MWLLEDSEMAMRTNRNKQMETSSVILFAVAILAGPWFAINDCMADVGEPLQNGEFSSNLNEWTTLGPVQWDAGAAVLGEGEGIMGHIGSSLSQEFTLGIPIASASLSFDYLAGFEADGLEEFKVYLQDPSSYDPLVAHSTDPYYFRHDSYSPDGSESFYCDAHYVTVTDIESGWRTVTLDLSSLGDEAVAARLSFSFVPQRNDPGWYDGQITIDNVAVTPVPVPSALVLGIAGFGTVLCRLRRRQ